MVLGGYKNNTCSCFILRKIIVQLDRKILQTIFRVFVFSQGPETFATCEEITPRQLHKPGLKVMFAPLALIQTLRAQIVSGAPLQKAISLLLHLKRKTLNIIFPASMGLQISDKCSSCDLTV